MGKDPQTRKKGYVVESVEPEEVLDPLSTTMVDELLVRLVEPGPCFQCYGVGKALEHFATLTAKHQADFVSKLAIDLEHRLDECMLFKAAASALYCIGEAQEKKLCATEGETDDVAETQI